MSAAPGPVTGSRARSGDGRGPVRVMGGARGNDDRVSGTDFAAEATAELYGSDPEAFTERRAALASQARAAGDRAAAREIAGLRKPTRPAWMINQLARADPGAVGRLASLGDQLRAAAAALDGAKIRELSQERRTLVDTLIRRALQQAGERSPRPPCVKTSPPRSARPSPTRRSAGTWPPAPWCGRSITPTSAPGRRS